MDIQERWEKALKFTEVIRSRVLPLLTFQATDLPYIALSESQVNIGDTVMRKGKVMVEKPTIILPGNLPQFEGFEFEGGGHADGEVLTNLLLVRGIRLPSLKYSNEPYTVDVFEGNLKKAIEHFRDGLQRAEDVHTGLIAGPEDCWQFSLLIFTCGMVLKSAEGDIKNILEDLRRRWG